MQNGNPSKDALLLARTSEFFLPWASWSRRAWDLGTLLALREAHEASDWVSQKVLSAGALTWFLRESLRPRLGQDLALGQGAVRQQLDSILKGGLRSGSHNHRALAHLVELVESEYLAEWRDAVGRDIKSVHVERTARYVASHMLDLGFDPYFLHREMNKVLQGTSSVDDYFDALIALERRGSRQFSGVVAFETMPHIAIAQRASAWVAPEQVRALVEEKLPGGSGLRQIGGLRFTVTARDPISAAREVGYQLDRLGNRTRYLREQSVPWRPHPWIFFDSEAEAVQMRDPDHKVDVLSLQNTGVLYEIHDGGRGVSRVDEALELAASLNIAAPSVAVAGGWASLESLLVSPEDAEDREAGKSVAADRAAWLVAASWPRAELTTLSHRLSNPPERLKRGLESAGDKNLPRCRILSEWLAQGREVDAVQAVDKAALERMAQLHSDPYPTLGRVNGYLRGTMRRLYRQRNIVLHGGSTQSVALRATLRTAAPLVGAALDRIAHGFIVGRMNPLECASRAQVSTSVVRDANAWKLYDLTGT